MNTQARLGPYSDGLGRNEANFAALSPIVFLPKAAAIYPNRIAIIHGEQRFTWAQTYERCRRLASALRARGIGPGDTVAVMAPNVPAIYEAHFGVPMAGAVLNTLNIRLDAAAIAFQLSHGQARVLITDGEFCATIKQVLRLITQDIFVIDIDDPLCNAGEKVGGITYEDFLASGSPDFVWSLPTDEFDPIALNYTSGTTGDPKGVVTHHRGAYLNAISEILSCNLAQGAVYLWTLPMFHCNGWCFPWSVAAQAGTNICLRRVNAEAVFDAISAYGVTNMCGAPIVYNMLINARAKLRQGATRPVNCMVAGAAPPASTIAGIEELGFTITHVYGLTETYGPSALCFPQAEWAALSVEERAVRQARQGVAALLQGDMTVMNPATMQPVPADGTTIGEVMFRGNITMNGYLKNPLATQAAFVGGWFHTGDLAVIETDGYVRIKDRSKDVIISGGENISSIEVEDVLHAHPAVDIAAVVAKPDAKWGEVPCAFIDLKPDVIATEEDIIGFCRTRLAGYKVPRHVVFGPIPKTATGKIQKYLLRAAAALENS